MNPQPVALTGLEPGPSPLREVSAMPVPETEADYPEFIALMEGQWEAQDTQNAQLADAVLGFLTEGKRPE